MCGGVNNMNGPYQCHKQDWYLSEDEMILHRFRTMGSIKQLFEKIRRIQQHQSIEDDNGANGGVQFIVNFQAILFRFDHISVVTQRMHQDDDQICCNIQPSPPVGFDIEFLAQPLQKFSQGLRKAAIARSEFA